MTVYVLTAIQYVVFLIFLLLAMMQAYAALYSKEERRFIRNRVKRNLRKQSNVTKKHTEESEVTKMFHDAGLHWMNNYRFAIFRVITLMFGALYFSVASTPLNTLVFVAIWAILTEPLFKFSLIRLFIYQRIKKIRENKEGELYSLFAMLKTDLLANTREEINVYHLLKDTMPYMNYIQPILGRFMRKWRESPELAGRDFEKELGGETAMFLGDFLGNLHSMSRSDALHVLDEQNEVFGHRRSEMLLQKAELQRNSFYVFFFVSAFVVIGWFMWFMYEMTSKSMNF